jgi:hypothetical protein
MTPQERDLILGLFQRLTPPPASDIDQEAHDVIDRLGREQPLALYMLAQTALVQEHALKGAQARIADLEARLAQGAPAAAPAAPRRSFLSGLMGGGDEPAAARPGYMPAPQAAPVGTPSPGPWGARGGPSFLQSALSTAAGVAGGALLFQGIEHLLGYDGGPFASAAAAQPIEEVIINNNPDTAPKDASAPGSDPASDPGNDPGFDPNDPSFAATPVDDPDFNSGDDGGLGGGDGFQDV